MADISKIKTLDGTTYDLKDAIARYHLPYGVCETGANTTDKTVTIEGITELTAGLTVAVKFTNNNAMVGPTLNVNGLGAKTIKQYGTVSVAAADETSGWMANSLVILVYDGTYWYINKGYNTNSTYTVTSVDCLMAGNSGVKRSVNATYYVLKAGNIFECTVQSANTYASALTLNINNTGAKPIYINGQPSSTTNYSIPAGKYLVYYDGNAYHFRTDNRQPINIQGTVNGYSISKSVPSNAVFTDTTYDAATATPLMDGTGAVGTSVKYAREDHRHPSDTSKLNKTAELLTTNPFAPESLKGPYISKIDNAFYAADKRWNTSITNASNSVSLLFDGSYETNVVISNGATSVLTMDFSTEYNGFFPGYPYGYILVSFYYRSAPASVSGRVYCNYEPHGIGWHDIAFSPMPDNQVAAITYRGYQGKYNISKLEITIVGDTTNPDGNTKPTQVEMHLDRPDSRRNPFLSKYGEETLYYPLTAPSFIGSLTGNASTATSAGSATKATQDESGNNIKASYASSMSISDHTITLKNKNGTSLGTVTVPDNNTTYTANTSKLVTTTVPNVTSVGSAPTLGTAIPADDITAWTSNTPTSASVSNGVLTIATGSAASLSYTAKSIPNVTSVGSAPTLGTAITVATGSLASNGGGGTVATGITAS